MTALARVASQPDDSAETSPFWNFPATPDFSQGPLKYDSAYPQQLFEFVKETGQSLTAFAAFLGTGRRTLDDWLDRYPEFRAAYEASRAIRTSTYERRLDAARLPAQVNATRFILINVAPDEYQMKVSFDVQSDATKQATTPLLGAISSTIERVTMTRTVVVREMVERESDAGETIEGNAEEVQETAAAQGFLERDDASDASDESSASTGEESQRC